MSGRDSRSVYRLIGFLFVGLTQCGGCSSGAETQASLPISESFLISGSVQAPGSGGAANLSPAAVRALATGGRNSVRFVLTDETPAAGAVCELIDSDGTILDTATADGNGDYSFGEVDGTLLNDAGDGDYTTFYVRCTVIESDGSSFVEMTTHSVLDSAVSTAGENAFTGLDVDPLSTAITLFNYRGTDINPLIATEDVIPDDASLDMPYRNAVNAALVDPVISVYENGGDSSGDGEAEIADLDGQVMDEAALLFIVAAYAVIDGTSGASVLDELFNLDQDADNAVAIENAFSGTAGFEALSETDIEGGLNALNALRDTALSTWSESDAFRALVAGNGDALRFFIGSSVFGSTLSEFQVLNYDTAILEAQLALLDGLDVGSLIAADAEGTIYETFGKVLDPEIVSALLDDEDAAAGLGALVETLFSGDVDAQLVSVVASCLDTLSADGTFWDQFVSGTEVNGESLGNFVEFFDAGVASGSFDDYFDNTTTFGWDEFFAGIDLDTDWASVGEDDFTEQSTSLFSETRVTVTAGSCATSDPDVDFCGTQNALASEVFPEGCWCDDSCSRYDDCCDDKTEACGESYIETYAEEIEAAAGSADSNGSTDGASTASTSSNNLPTASGTSFYTSQGAALEFDLASYVSDADGDTVTCQVQTHPVHGTLTAFDESTCSGTFAPDSNFVGDDSFEFKVYDGIESGDTATVTLHVVPEVGFASATGSGSEGTTSHAISVQLSSAGSSAVVVPFMVSGTATFGTDYSIDTGSSSNVTYDSGTGTYELTIPAGTSSGTVTILPVDDVSSESDETIVFHMDDPADNSAFLGSQSTHTFTLTNDDDDDSDGYADANDNCSSVANSTQADFDEDGVGDACDDYDGDFVKDDVDSCRIFTSNSACSVYPYDQDNDGYTQSSSSVGLGVDTNDSDASVHP